MADEVDPLEDPEERKVLFGALDSFRLYRTACHYNITHMRRRSFYALPTAHMELLSSPPFDLPGTFQRIDGAIDINANIADAILSCTLEMYGLDPEDDSAWRDAASSNDMDKARSTIRQIYRDWSAEAAEERKACYGPMLAALDKASADVPIAQRAGIRVLVPGAGLGRLAFEVCRAGYTVQGNEISYHQLMASNWILNHVRSANSIELFPWVLNMSNRISREHQMRKVLIPDVSPFQAHAAASERLETGQSLDQRMSMSAGDFCVTYKAGDFKDAFAAVLTCFFIDTAPNLISYIEAICNCLSAGGVWINLGPLLWHFDGGKTGTSGEGDQKRSKATGHDSDAGIGEAGSFELSNDEVLTLVEKYGFELLHHEILHEGAGYIHDPDSMLHNVYRPSFWVAKKRPETS